MRQKREINIDENVAYITLTRGAVAVIDIDDVPLIGEFNWFSVVQKHTSYAVRRVSGVKGLGSKISMHRMIMSASESVQIDHIDGNGLNNRKSNLRIATVMENSWNRRRNSANTSGYKGVCWNKASKKWQAQIRTSGKMLYLGLFENAKDAHAAYCSAAYAKHGNFARIS